MAATSACFSRGLKLPGRTKWSRQVTST